VLDFLALFDFEFDEANNQTGVVVQLVRIPACHAGGRGFESRPLRQQFYALSQILNPITGVFYCLYVSGFFATKLLY
jgi:hypothetical protein